MHKENEDTHTKRLSVIT